MGNFSMLTKPDIQHAFYHCDAMRRSDPECSECIVKQNGIEYRSKNQIDIFDYPCSYNYALHIVLRDKALKGY